MIEGYQTKDIKKTSNKKNKIIEEDGIWKFKWKGNECGYLTKEDAEAGLKKLSEEEA